MTNVVQMRRPANEPSQIGCSMCGATTDAACDCGASYVPAGQRAAEAITANPEKSDRAIAAEIGVDHKTVGAARRSVGEHSPPEKRVGQDGKSYPAKSTKLVRQKAREARFDKDKQKTANAVTEAFIAAGKLSDQQIADFRERGIVPPFRLFTPCGMAFDGGPDMEESCKLEESAPDDEAQVENIVERVSKLSNKAGNKATRNFIKKAMSSALSCHDYTDDMIVTDEVLEAGSCAADAWAALVTELKAVVFATIRPSRPAQNTTSGVRGG
jgi:hypothetical protein